MKKFKFQLETLLKISNLEKEKAELAFSAAVQALRRQQDFLQKLQEELVKGKQDYEKMLLSRRVSAGQMQMYGDYFSFKQKQIDLQQVAVRNAEKKKAEKLQKMLEISKKVKALEQLKAERFLEYKQTLLAEEQKEIDEIGLQVYIHKSM